CSRTPRRAPSPWPSEASSTSTAVAVSRIDRSLCTPAVRTTQGSTRIARATPMPAPSQLAKRRTNPRRQPPIAPATARTSRSRSNPFTPPPPPSPGREAGVGEEAGVADHAVVGAHGLVLDVPPPLEHLDRLRGEPRALRERVAQPGHLDDAGRVGDQQPDRAQRGRR